MLRKKSNQLFYFTASCVGHLLVCLWTSARAELMTGASQGSTSIALPLFTSQNSWTIKAFMLNLTIFVDGNHPTKVPCQSLCSTHWGWGHHSFGEPLSRSRHWICWRKPCSEVASDQPDGTDYRVLLGNGVLLGTQYSPMYLWAPLPRHINHVFSLLYLTQFGTEPNGMGEKTKLLSTTGVKSLPCFGAWTIHLKSLHWCFTYSGVW